VIAGYKTVSFASGVMVAVLASPELQALIAQYPVQAFWINNVLMIILRHFTTTPLPWLSPKS
jgi:hypothetical protein